MDSGDNSGQRGGAVWAMGLMSGTSADGVDAALIRTDGTSVAEFGPSLTEPYDNAFRLKLKGAFGSQAPVPEIERELTERHASAVQALLAKAGRGPRDVAVVGFHGQTLHHAPERRQTWQIGDGALLAKLTGIEVVNDFRSADVAAGGQGAPLVPVYHAALAGALAKPLAVLNIGGVGNVTWIGADGSLLAFDTGPGNALLDDWVMQHTGRHADLNGALARQGRVDAIALGKLLSDPFFGVKPPKSLDRQHFKQLAAAALATLSPADGAATLVGFTALAIGRAQLHFPAPVREWLVCGGGRHNPALMQALKAELPVPVRSADEAGWDGDALEAQAFAFLAVRSLRGLPLSFPTTTGVPHPMQGGRHHAFL
ncbi:MAG TPA: anhydro-N-acetylmuramic acid kinase [Dongiaceae bacterium]|nr:anhydro-N-acetylmuramic acid kinase [Dongiaceae bacterium]